MIVVLRWERSTKARVLIFSLQYVFDRGSKRRRLTDDIASLSLVLSVVYLRVLATGKASALTLRLLV